MEIEVDDPKKAQMNAFMMSPQNQQEIAANDTKIHDTVEQINNLKTSREFYLSFADNPQEFITNWLISQTRDLKVLVHSLLFAYIFGSTMLHNSVRH